MPRAVRLAFVAVLMAALSTRAAEEPSPATKEPGAAMSPRMRTVLKAFLPNQGILTGGPTGQVTDTATATTPEADPSVIRMERYIVKDVSVPTAAEAMSPAAIAEMAMNKYLGSRDGLDRGFLNRFTLGQIPVIGGIFTLLGLSTSNEQRALGRYYEDERLRKMNDLLDLGAITTKTGDAGLGEKIRRETEKAFLRK